MFRFILVAALCSAAFGQTDITPAGKAPAKVEQALRARVSQFYSLLAAQQYRQAEAFVADDTKDYYYSSNKPQITKFEISSVTFYDKFARAGVITKCSQKTILPGFPGGEWEMKVPSAWKLERKQWYFYVDQTVVMSPLGVLSKAPAPGAQQPGGNAAAPVKIPEKIPTSPDFVLGKVHADKASVSLEPGGADQVKITNGAQGPFSIILTNTATGVEVKLDSTDLKAGGTALLSVTAGPEPKSGTIYLQLVPTNEVIRIAVEVK